VGLRRQSRGSGSSAVSPVFGSDVATRSSRTLSCGTNRPRATRRPPDVGPPGSAAGSTTSGVREAFDVHRRMRGVAKEFDRAAAMARRRGRSRPLISYVVRTACSLHESRLPACAAVSRAALADVRARAGGADPGRSSTCWHAASHDRPALRDRWAAATERAIRCALVGRLLATRRVHSLSG